MRAPELEPNKGWLNTDRPLTLPTDLAGRVVLLEFFSPTRIACDHVLEGLRWLEHKYRDLPFNVVGVCGLETPDEERPDRVRHDLRRRGVTHPVVIDHHFKLWRAYQVKQWPTFVLVGPTGEIIGQVAGEGHRMVLDRYVTRLLADGRLDKTLAAGPLATSPEPDDPSDSPLRYPAGLLAVAPRVGVPGRLYVSDTLRHRVLIADWPDVSGAARVLTVYGGDEGLHDGGPDAAKFRTPRALALDHANARLFVADTANHAVRMIDLKTETVRTIAGTGEPAGETRGGAVGVTQPLRSPLGLAIDDKRRRLLIAMAGDHRVWSIDLTTMVTRAIAGTGRARVVDGRVGFSEADAMFAQPSSITVASDGAAIYTADAAGSAIRQLDPEADRVRTIIGRPRDATGDDEVLSDSADVDGAFPDARLFGPNAMCLWATTPMHASGDRLLVADTRNDKIKLIDPLANTIETWADNLARPAAVCVAPPRLGDASAARVFVADTDRHRILSIDAATRERTEIAFEGLS